MRAQILYGRPVAKKILDTIKEEFIKSSGSPPPIPSLHIIKANKRLDTETYIKAKIKAITSIGFRATVHDLSDADFYQLRDKIWQLNEDKSCHGILLQSPIDLTHSASAAAAIVLVPDPFHRLAEIISPIKDVDGLSPFNVAKLMLRRGEPHFYPCTPNGIMHLLKYYNMAEGLSGKRVAIIGRSEIVGMPMAMMFTRSNATVTLCHSKTKDLPDILRSSDITVAAIGRPNWVKGDWIKDDSIVIDVGINRSPDGATGFAGTSKIVGDVDFEAAKHKAAAITPAPGGVGPLTVAMVVSNLLKAASLQSTGASGTFL